MKTPFSYKQHFFQSVLWTSFFAHVSLFGIGSFIAPNPQYAVEQAPASMEVVILPAPRSKTEPKVKESKTIDSDEAQQKVIQEKKSEPERENQKIIHIPEVKGALTEAKPAYLKNPAPIYPEYAREREWEGTVLLKVLVSSEGKVAEIQVEQSSGHGILDDSALKVVRKWQFQPARVGGMVFSSWIKIPVRFVLMEKR